MSEHGHMRYRIGTPGAPATAPASVPPRPRSAWRRVVALACWLYVVGLVVVAMLLWWAPIELWPVQLFVYLPRLVLGLPLLVLVPAAALAKRRGLILPLAVAAVVLIGPILGFTLPWRTLVSGGPPQLRVRVLTANVEGDAYSPDRLGALVATRKPDLILLQEWPGREPDFLREPDGWSVRQGDGMLVASRFPIRRMAPIRAETEYQALALHLELDVRGRGFHLVNLHLETPRDGIEELVAEQMGGVAAFRQVAEVQRRESEAVTRALAPIRGPLLIGGDFNLTVESPIYRRYWSGFRNAFSTAGLGFGYTRYERKLVRSRIDHVLGGPGWRPVWCWVGPDIASDHLPVLADLEWVAPLPEPDAIAAGEPPARLEDAPVEVPDLPIRPPDGVAPPPPPASEPAPKPAEPAPAPPAAPEAPPDPRRERLEFRRALQRLLEQHGNGAGPAIRDLCQRAGATAPPRAAAEPAPSKLDRRGRIRLYRAQGVPEAAIVLDLAAGESRMIGARKGPRSPAEALVRAARYVLSVPVE